jgi:predicted TIM-barrel fold metal-dependent hydrolase
MRNGRRILDADAHVIEPGGIFGDAHRFGVNPIHIPDTTPTDACGGADLADQWENGWDAPSYLRAMDAQGIDAAVLYPSIGLFVPFQADITAAQSAAACAGYAEWVAAYCDTAPLRLAAVGIAPTVDPARAVIEARRAARLGLVGMLVRPNHLYGRNLGDPAFDPLYDEMAGLGLVLAVHEGLGVDGPTTGADRFGSFVGRHACSHPMEQMTAMASLVLDGVLERHPGLRVAFLESGTGWLPYWLDRLDDHVSWMSATETAGLSLSASEYFSRQCAISTDPEDRLAAFTAARVGADHLLWASDFPHPDAEFPGAVDEFERHNPELDGAALDALMWSSPAEFYRLADRFVDAGARAAN